MELLITFALICALAFFAQKSSSNLFTLFARVVRSERIALYLVCLLYLPGTFLHEVAHLLTALLLFLPVTRFSIIPHVTHVGHGYAVKMGSVSYIPKDPIRGFLVGIAPIFFGMGFFLFLPNMFAVVGESLVGRLIVSYLALTVSSTMISSKQDLTDAVYMLPLVFIGAAALYIFNIDILSNQLLLEFISQMNYYLTTALLINLGVFFATKLVL